MLNNKMKYLLLISTFVLSVLFLQIVSGCGSDAPPLREEKNSCSQDEDCPLGSFCRQQQCTFNIEIHGESIQDGGSAPEHASEQKKHIPDLECIRGTARKCFHHNDKKPVGQCRSGQQKCIDGFWGSCQGQILPGKEICNGKDDDCDGNIDNAKDSPLPLEKPCSNICQKGIQKCYRGSWQACNAQKPKIEKCNGIDDDCNGKIDEQLTSPLCKKQQGVCANSRRACAGKKGWLACESKDYKKHSLGSYQKIETECDGKDNDCDGQTDPEANCNCQNGTFQSCYSGSKATKGIGVCRAGRQYCSSGKWSICKEEKLPSMERCNQADDDCDGKVDNQAGSEQKLHQSCKTDCGVGRKSCIHGLWTDCSSPLPQKETCNNKDDDCNGKIDDKVQQNCSTDCGKGYKACKAGKWQKCTAKEPIPEECNNKDDNCDGKVDNLPSKGCKSKCGIGQQACYSGKWSLCSAPTPKHEQCNGKDDDCDGEIDENIFRSCSTTCGKGKESCRLGTWKNCTAPIPRNEKCNGKDDDCDGKIDNIKGSTASLSMTCKTLCEMGKTICLKGKWLSCTARKPKVEECNGKDDDCDGKTDNVKGSSKTIQQACKTRCGLSQQSCIKGRWSQCSVKKPTLEKCNGKDDDCDGNIDNIVPRECLTSCGKGKSFCKKGGWSTCLHPSAKAETCNGKDDDCDGKTDNIAEKPCKNSCGKGKFLCIKAQLTCNAPKPTLEKCNGKDDDCDGKIDEVCFTKKLFLQKAGSGFTASISQDNRYLGVLTYEGNVQFLQTEGAKKLWEHTSGLATGVAFTKQALQVAQSKNHFLAITGQDSYKNPVMWYYKQKAYAALLQKQSNRLWKSLSMLEFGEQSNSFLVLDPLTLGAHRGAYKVNSKQKLEVSWRTYALNTKTIGTGLCQPFRIAMEKHNFAISCNKDHWYPISKHQPYLRRLPSPKQLQKAGTNTGFVYINYTQGVKNLQKVVQLPALPIDLSFIVDQKRSLLLVGTQPILKKQMLEPSKLFFYDYARANLAIQEFTIPTTNSKLSARLIGIRTTKDGIVILAIQEFFKRSPFTAYQNRVEIHHLKTLLQKKWNPIQTFRLRNPPEYISLSMDQTRAVVLCPQKNSYDLLLLTRKK